MFSWGIYTMAVSPLAEKFHRRVVLRLGLLKDGGTLCQRHVLVGKRMHGIQWDSKKWGFNMIQRSMMGKIWDILGYHGI